MPFKTNPAFAPVFTKLKGIMRKFEKRPMKAATNKPGNYVLTGPPSELTRGKDLWFGAVQTRKNYVSYHLISVYAFPDLLEGMSPALKKRMQGKSCFNFTVVDDDLFRELAALTNTGYQRFKKAKFIK